MADIIDLKDGVYEKVISRDFDKKLTKALADKEIWADREDVDAQEAVGYLSSYLEKLIRLCLKDIADEEIVHAGEFLRLLHELAPDEAAFYAQGAQEVEEMIAEENGEEDTAPDEPQAASTVGDLFKKA